MTISNLEELDDFNKKKEARHYMGKKHSDIVNFPVNFRRMFLLPSNNKEILEAPISTFRIIFKVLNDISNDQFQEKKQIGQLRLFEEDFMTEHNTYAKFTFKVQDIDKNKDYKAIKKGLEFLENLEKGWHKSVNSKGKTIRSYGGVISNSNISDGHVSFLMSSYWIAHFLNIPSYNSAIFKTPWVLTNVKHVLFYLWLLEVPEKGTKIKFDKFQDTYQYNYQNAQDLARYALKVIKEKLDKYSNQSFNYSTSKDIINIVPYKTKDVELELTDKTIKTQHISQKLHYWKVRHELTSDDISVLKSLINIDNGTFDLFLKSYDSFVKNCKENKEKVTIYKGKQFIKMFQDEIISVYNKSVWSDINPNAYPIISK